jgi:hypothetical protein
MNKESSATNLPSDDDWEAVRARMLACAATLPLIDGLPPKARLAELLFDLFDPWTFEKKDEWYDDLLAEYNAMADALLSVFIRVRTEQLEGVQLMITASELQRSHVCNERCTFDSHYLTAPARVTVRSDGGR